MKWMKCPLCNQEVDVLIGAVIGGKHQAICRGCLDKGMDRARKIIEERDKRKNKDRVARLVELGSIVYSSVEKQPPYYLEGYIKEAGESYLEGAFRSCIFCCADAVEQIIKHELIREADDSEEKMWEFEIKRHTFGRLIDEAKKVDVLEGHLSDARWLNDVRIIIAVHPLYVGAYEKNDDLQTKIWKNRTMIRNVRKTIEFLGDKDKETVLNSQLNMLEEGKWVTLNDMLKDPSSDHIFVWWGLLEKDVLERLALEAYTRMKKIAEGIYSTKQR